MKTYRGLTLDRFQQEAIAAFDAGENILCCAPTGAGKTLLAEYAIEQILAQGGEVAYTAPIKALSNQKYRDFIEIYGEDRVGIITGDVILNPGAPLLLMTTEIYRNIMYDSPERLSRMQCVIFDEVHYIEDEKRGTVWEESLMLSPPHIRFLCLSATVANADLIAEWLTDIRIQTTRVIFHDVRPVPLSIGFFVEDAGYFNDKQLLKAVRVADQQRSRRGPRGRKADVVDWLNNNNRLPALYFCFSRKRCELMAERYARRSLSSPEESAQAVAWYENFLAGNDLDRFRSARDLGQLIAAGVAWHHAGMLPPLKEAVEVLFGKGLIKLLFATETFALGINMPARSAIFSSLEKNDGISFRYLRAYEFQQMAGRAGRRGIDELGYVVVMLEPKYARYEETKITVFGKVEPLTSRFGFSYSSLMNLLERFDVDGIKEVAQRSLASRQAERDQKQLERKITTLEEEVESLPCVHSRGKAMERLEAWVRINEALDKAKMDMDEMRQKVRGKGARDSQGWREKLKELAGRIGALKKQKQKMSCRKCFDGSQCMVLVQRLRALRKQQKNAGTRMLDMIDRKFALLQSMGYVDGRKLLPRGQIASSIFGYEIQATELYFDGWLGRLEPVALIALLSTITHERRRDEPGRLRRREFRRILQTYSDRLEEIRREERRVIGEELTSAADPGFADAAAAWAEGIPFEELLGRFPDFAEGDMIRQLRQVIDLIRQLRRACAADLMTRDKLDQCMELINRDVVDAERFL